MKKIRIAQVAIATSSDDTWDALLVDDRGRLWRMTIEDKFVQIELPREPEED